MADNRPPGTLRPRRGFIIRQAIGLGVVAGLAFGVGLLGRTWPTPHARAAPQRQLAVAGAAFRAGDDATALALFTRLADDNNPAAEYWLAHMTELGIGVARDPTKALALYRKAAAQGNVPAEARLGEIYLDGDVVPPNFDIATRYLEQAALRGNKRAATALSRVYRYGLGRPRDLVEAYSWLEVAVLEGGAPGERERDRLMARLSAPQQQAALARTDYLMTKIETDAPAASPVAARATRSAPPGAPAADVPSRRPGATAASASAQGDQTPRPASSAS